MARSVSLSVSLVVAALALCRPACSQACRSNKQVIYKVDGRASLVLTEGQESIVSLKGQVLVKVPYGGAAELRVRRLLLTGPDGKIPSPPGLELPVRLDVRGARARRLQYEERDSTLSRAVKRAILDLLPKQAFYTQEDSGFDVSQIRDTLNLLREGEEKIDLHDDHKDVVLVLGNTGAGKTTFTQWIAGYTDRLTAKEVEEGYEEFIIEDSLNRIGNSVIDSKTMFPEYVIDKDNSVAYYDFPGFADTRAPSHSIATSYFIKKTIDHIQSVKFVFVISYPSVRKGVDRQSFLKLLRHITELVKNFDKFQNSTAIIVTKVDNQYVLKNKKMTLVSDDQVISGIVNYMLDAKQDLEQKIKEGSSTSAKELHFYKNAVKFIEAILMRNGGNYNKIGIFRRPSEPGMLKDMKLFEIQREYIKKNVIDALSYTPKDIDDIDTTISEKSKNDINSLVQEINKWILFTVCHVAGKVQEHYGVIEQELNNKIMSFDTNNLTFAGMMLSEATELLDEFGAGYSELEKIIQGIKTARDVNDVSKLFQDRLPSLHVDISKEIVSNISTQEIYLKFLRNVSGDVSNIHISPVAWASPFQDLLMHLSTTKNSFDKDVENFMIDIDDKTNLELEKLGKELKKHYSMKEEFHNDIYVLNNILTVECDEIYDKFIAGSDFESISHIQSIADNLNELNITFNDDLKESVINNSKYMNHLQEILINVREYVCNSQTWYHFLIDLYEKLSTYDIQKDLRRYSTVTEEITQLDEKMKVSDTNLISILIRFYQGNDFVEYGKIENITLDILKLRHLKKVFSITLDPPNQSCESQDTLVIKGHNVRLSDIIYMACPEQIKVIKIFAQNIFFIDTDYNAKGKIVQFVIIAPIWEVVGNDTRKIVLDGVANFSLPLKALDGAYPAEHGHDGLPGLPGSSGGNFFGFGETFINNLFVSSIGSVGQPGQDGGDGARGYNGTVLQIYDPKQYLIDNGIYYDSTKYKLYPIYWEWIINGKSCSDGGDAGKGGVGGDKGYPGYIDFIDSAKPLSATTLDNQVMRESDGESGIPGPAGTRGQYAIIYRAPLKFWDHMTVEYFYLPECHSGRTVTGVNSVGKQTSERVAVREPRKSFVIQYMSFLTDSLNYSVNEDTMRLFLKKLENSNKKVEYLDDKNAYNIM